MFIEVREMEELLKQIRDKIEGNNDTIKQQQNRINDLDEQMKQLNRELVQAKTEKDVVIRKFNKLNKLIKEVN